MDAHGDQHRDQLGSGLGYLAASTEDVEVWTQKKFSLMSTEAATE
jgi:hypothetical protein